MPSDQRLDQHSGAVAARFAPGGAGDAGIERRAIPSADKIEPADDVAIDKLTPQQQAYLASWNLGT